MRLFEAARLLTFSAFRMGAYSKKYGNHHKLLAFRVISHGRFDCMMM